MDDTFELIFGISIGLVVGCLLGGFIVGYQCINQPQPICEAPIINLTCPESTYSCNIPELSCPKPFCDVTCQPCEKDIIIDTIKDVPNMREYEINVWDCTEMSNEIVRRFKEIGFKSEVVMGLVNCDSKLFECQGKSRHDWVKVEVYIESTRGHIIHPDNYDVYNIK